MVKIPRPINKQEILWLTHTLALKKEITVCLFVGKHTLNFGAIFRHDKTVFTTVHFFIKKYNLIIN
jgi:hypothetical protein